jgi:L-seryl-tRNA(Ser) seleniumtransferase
MDRADGLTPRRVVQDQPMPPAESQHAGPADDAKIAGLLRQLPSVDALAERVADAQDVQPPRTLVTEACRSVIDDCRRRIRLGELPGVDVGTLAQQAAGQLSAMDRPVLESVINATGILLHTGLGRSPMAAEAVAALADVGQHYAPVEIDMQSGQRNRRADVVRDLLCSLTGSESATVVNNNAAATLLTLAAVAGGKQVIVSRGELIEIGGSFRLPDVMQISRATLREVGTTNRTRLADYADAVGPETGAILKAHCSNYRIVGFTEATPVEDLVGLAQQHDVPLIDDIGSGALRSMARYGLADEPVASQSIAAGAGLVLFSGDKLLGGPQAGIIVGRRQWIERIESHPLYRAFRVDKLTLAALGRTLQLHRDPAEVERKIPLYRMLCLTLTQLRQRGEALAGQLNGKLGSVRCEVVEAQAHVGGGSTPAQAIPSIALRLTPGDGGEQQWADRLRQANPRVLSRLAKDAVWFDLRSVLDDQLNDLARAIVDTAPVPR